MADAIIDLVGPDELDVISTLYNQIFRPSRDVDYVFVPTIGLAGGDAGAAGPGPPEFLPFPSGSATRSGWELSPDDPATIMRALGAS